ncbi:hypothetical protein RhiirC2_799667 [Rhizophagus irregularis]|uniref:Uncharacterized protein n=1 Tax=Rhizophagus irregularis TaxID=588596 RepID=A0A2N1M4M5_9GLOM|nr:hypothetical protein RhiirC2_799667 [Rhizophagus irregularis]
MGFGIWDGIWVGWDWDLGLMGFGIFPIPLIWAAIVKNAPYCFTTQRKKKQEEKR